MSSASVPNTFASQSGPIPLAQLDTNFVTLTGYLNDPYNRNNYVQDSGGTNTIALTFNPAAGGYTVGLEITWKQLVTNTGTPVVNVNSLGAKSILNPDGSAPAAGHLVSGVTYKAVYNGVVFYLQGGRISATQAEMETATVSASFVSPGNFVYSPFSPKAWGTFVGTATGTTTFTSANGAGASTVSRSGTGTYVVSFTRAFSSATYGVIGITNAGAIAVDGGHSSQTCTILLRTTADTAAVDATLVSFMAFGDLA